MEGVLGMKSEGVLGMFYLKHFLVLSDALYIELKCVYYKTTAKSDCNENGYIFLQ